MKEFVVTHINKHLNAQDKKIIRRVISQLLTDIIPDRKTRVKDFVIDINVTCNPKEKTKDVDEINN
tara:strand:- start:91 stop:288 length:198 start_codon:yes stop_codon:yes gene_type:complete